MKITWLTMERVLLIIVTILALTGWARPFHPTADNLNIAADEVVQENPNLAVVLYTVADALEEGYIHPLAFVSTAFQERYILNSVELSKKNKTDIDT